MSRTTVHLLAAAAVVAALTSCSSDPATGELQLIVADQTVENPIRDVVEVRLSDGSTVFPDSATGGSSVAGGEWILGEEVSIVIWPNATDEPTIPVALSMPKTGEVFTVAVVIEIEDDAVLIRSEVLAYSNTFERDNPAREQSEAEAERAEEEQAAAEEAARVATMAVRREAAKLVAEMRRMEDDLFEVLDEHRTVYGDDDWASFSQIARKYRNYTSEALDDLYASLPNSAYDTREVVDANAIWQKWWSDYIAVHSRSETAARNNDSTAMDAVRVDENGLWDLWPEMFEAVDALTSFTDEG